MGDSMSERGSKHKYVKNQPTQNELATCCHKDHDLREGPRSVHFRSQYTFTRRTKTLGGQVHL